MKTYLLDFPVANLNAHQVIPKDMMIITEAIVNHDGQQQLNAAQAHQQHGDVYLASPTGEEIYVQGAGILSKSITGVLNGGALQQLEPLVSVAATRTTCLEDAVCIEISHLN